MNPEQQLKKIGEKLQLLLKRFESLRQENEKLRAALEPAKQREIALQTKIADLEQQVIVLKMAAAPMDEAEKKELDKKLNTYLKEIDRCIGMLSS
ncbi:MAG: hypothetical protein JNL51_08450 [Chitinophagaceae bacterium]|nr:hypothetical protein [Chitinophagaceae bacterium]